MMLSLTIITDAIMRVEPLTLIEMSEEKKLTRRRILTGVGAGSAALAGCSGQSGTTPTPTEDSATDTPSTMDTSTQMGEDESGMANIRIAHLSPDAPNVDVSVNGSVIFEDVSFGTVSEYVGSPAGEQQVRITTTGNDETTVFEGTVPTEAETNYTVTARGEISEGADEPFELLTLEGSNSTPGSNMARVRLVHVSPDAPAVDVTLASNGDVLYDGVTYGDSANVTVPAGDYTLQVRGDSMSNDGDVVAEFDVTLRGEEAYTAFAGGYLSTDDDPSDSAFGLLVSQDTAAGATSGFLTATTSTTTNLRVAHLSPNAPNVNVSLDGNAILEDVGFGAVSEYLEAPVGERQIQITLADDAGTTVTERSVSIEAETDYTIAASGEVGDAADEPFQLLALRDDNSEVQDNSTRIRVVHLSPDASSVDVTVDSTMNTLFDGVAYGESGYTTVPAGEYTLNIRDDMMGMSNTGDIVQTVDVTLAEGETYTAFAGGYLTPDDDPADTAFGVLVSQDTASGGTSGLTGKSPSEEDDSGSGYY